ncbi:MAG: helix-turn-helix transcriptional regulator [Clostridium sp.]|nr:helix-turn-helix transcriptional regulator [Clostridium sp.]
MILKKMREERGLTAKFVYSTLGVKQSTFSRYENCNRFPPLKFFMGLKDIYNLNDSEVLTLMQVAEKEVIDSGKRVG